MSKNTLNEQTILQQRLSFFSRAHLRSMFCISTKQVIEELYVGDTENYLRTWSRLYHQSVSRWHSPRKNGELL